MHLIYDPSLDGWGWPGPLGDGDAASGVAWVGPMGLLGMLETHLGLGGLYATRLERACRLARGLRGEGGFWRRSFDRDPVGTSRRLLADRDTLAMWGWRGQPVSPRLTELHRITRAADPGLPDRLANVAQTLRQRRAIDIASLSLFSPASTMEPLWRDVFAALGEIGVAVDERALPIATARGDLARARSHRFVPEGDGSLVLLRRHGVLDAADEVAATLAAFDDLSGIVVVGGDAILDRALGRHGLPRLGLDAGPTASAQLVPLLVEAAFDPMEPDDLHALLMLDPGPVPRALAAHLVRALQRHPGRKSVGWSQALTKGLEAYPAERQQELRARVQTLLMPAVAHQAAVPVVELRARLRVARAWAAARSVTAETVAVVWQQIDALAEALELLGEETITRAELRRLCGDLVVPDWAHAAAEAGLAHVSTPGALLGPARTVIWWNFTRDQAPRAGRLFLTQVEQEALLAAGVTPPDFAVLMEGEAQRFRRPLALATDTLALVCPQSGEGGEANQIHPLWDQLTASLACFDDVARLHVSNLSSLRRARAETTTLRSMVTPATSVVVSAPLKLRDVESPSSLERLLGCSFSWALHYTGHLRPGLSEGPAGVTPLLMGTIAHDVLAQVFAQNARDPEVAAAVAESLFDAQAPALCEALGLPRYQVQRATLRRTVVESARRLTHLMVAAGAQVVGTEMDQTITIAGQKVEGTLDLVLSSPDFVIDLKWGKARNREKLYSGTAVQLATYAAMRAGTRVDTTIAVADAAGGNETGIGYFILRTQELLTEPGARLSGGHAPGKHTGAAIWTATLAGIETRRRDLTEGRLSAPGADPNQGPDEPSALTVTGLRIAPACEYCAFAGVCGRKGAQ